MITLKQSDIDPDMILITSTRPARYQNISQDNLWAAVHSDILADLFPDEQQADVTEMLRQGEEVICECVLTNEE